MTARPRSDFAGPALDEVLATERLSREDACRRAAVVVAGRAADLTECRELLAMLGLSGTADAADTADPGAAAPA